MTMIPKRFHPSEFDQSHVETMTSWADEKKKVKVLVELKPVERVLKEDSIGFYIEIKGQRVAVRPDPNILGATCLVGLSPETIERVRRVRNKNRRAIHAK